MNAWQKGFLGSLVVLTFAWLYGLNWDQRITDAHDHWRAAISRPNFPEQIVVVALDDLSLKNLKSFAGQIPRRRYAELLDNLQQARAVGIDVVLDEKNPYDPAGDRMLEDAVQRHGRVVLSMFAWQGAHPVDQTSQQETEALTRSETPGRLDLASDLETINAYSLEMPYSPLREGAALLGFADVNADADNIYRRPILVRQRIDTGDALPQFALAVACLATRTPVGEAMRDLPHQLQLGGTTVPLSQQGSLLLRPIARRGGDYHVRLGAPIPTVSFYEALRAPPEAFKDKIVLVGTTAAGVSDIRATPIDNGLRGVELNAEILADLLYLPPNRPTGLFLQWSLILLAISLPLYLFSKHPPSRATAGSALTLIGLILSMEASYWTLEQVPSWSAVLLSFGAATMITGLERLREEAALRQMLRSRFSSYIAPEMVDRLVRDPDHTGSSARRMRAAILFSDIRDFTTYSEQVQPDVVREQIEAYLAEMTMSVRAQHGIVANIMGDGVMALFGPFYEEEGHEAEKALACALDMLDRLEGLNVRWRAENQPTFRMGIGIHVGSVLFGEFGSPDRYTLTALGDNVNLASRLETATKDLQVAILTTEALRSETETEFSHLVRFEDQGLHRLRGRTQSTHLFSVHPLRGPAAPDALPDSGQRIAALPSAAA